MEFKIKGTFKPKYLGVIFHLKRDSDTKWKILRYDPKLELYFRSMAVDTLREKMDFTVEAPNGGYTEKEIDRFLELNSWVIELKLD